MRIVVDADIAGVPERFSPFGDVVVRPGRAICAADLRDADALIVRSVTRVDAALLAGSRVRFVGTATSGEDHIDLAYLKSAGIAFANAAGCNTRPVAEYVMVSLLEWALRTGGGLPGRTLGIIGFGRIGSLVADWAAALGMSVLACDPPRARQGHEGLESLDCVLAGSDIVSVHVPLVVSGSDATAGMVDAAWLGRLRPGAWLINTSRGEVVDDKALSQALASGHVGGVILDVWRNEPRIDRSFLARVAIGTPHIAGYSGGAHRRAANLMIQSLARSAGTHADRLDCVDAAGRVNRESSPQDRSHIHADIEIADVHRLLSRACDLSAIDALFRQSSVCGELGPAFDNVRRSCRARLEFSELAMSRGQFDPNSAEFLRKIGVPDPV